MRFKARIKSQNDCKVSFVDAVHNSGDVLCIPMISISDSGDSDRSSRAVYFYSCF
jgi:hypothetical protein